MEPFINEGLQHEANCHWFKRSLHCFNSVLHLRGPMFGKQCTLKKRHPKETRSSATYMVVELLVHFWCHQSHFHLYPHTNNIQCCHGTEWVHNSHVHHTGEWTDQLLFLFGRKCLRFQELLLSRAGIWSLPLLWEKTDQWMFLLQLITMLH